MSYIPITPFRRPVDAGLIKHVVQTAEADLPPEGVNKWEVLRELGAAAPRLGISDRELTVLQSLLSFHPETILGGNSDELVVFPSNASICERLNGMPCSTMRRHLAGLVRAGLIIRRDSPNGKRYARRHSNGSDVFGFDLTPLVARFSDISRIAEDVRAEKEAYRRLRTQVSLMRRDLAGLAIYGPTVHSDTQFWNGIAEHAQSVSTVLRRKLTMAELAELEGSLAALLDTARGKIDELTTYMSTKESRNEQHDLSSNTNIHDLEQCLEQAQEISVEPNTAADEKPEAAMSSDDTKMPNVPLGLVLAVCSEFKAYVPDKVRHWHQLVHAADVLRPMMGISPSAWNDAILAMGPEEAAVVLLAMLERSSEIKSPGGYLRRLTLKAANGEFSCGPMVMALLRKQERAA